MTNILLIIVIGYFLGNFAASYFLGKSIRNADIREHGSGNAGATNALRVFGLKLGAASFILDALKGVVAVLIGRWLFGDTGALIAGISVVIGHNWPVLLGFRGGKGIATSIGVIITIKPLIGIIGLIIGLTIIYLTRYVSLGSITAAISLPIIGLLLVRPFDRDFFIFTVILFIMALYRHKTNVKRLLSGTESKLGQKAK